MFWGPCTDTVVYIIAVLMFISAAATNALLIAALYGRVRPTVGQILWLAFALEGMLCGGLYLTNTALSLIW